MIAHLLTVMKPPSRVDDSGKAPGSAILPVLQEHFAALDREELVVAGFDRGLRLLSYVHGTGHAFSIEGGMAIVRQALAPQRLSFLLLAHNHPCGSPLPSEADLAMTRRVVALARLAGVAVSDHLIFAGARVVSFRALGLL